MKTPSCPGSLPEPFCSYPGDPVITALTTTDMGKLRDLLSALDTDLREIHRINELLTTLLRVPLASSVTHVRQAATLLKQSERAFRDQGGAK